MEKQPAQGNERGSDVVRAALGLVGAGEETLLAAVRRGEIEAFNTLFLRHYPTVFGLLYRLVGDEVDDLAQETFLRLYRRPPRDPESSVRAWLCRVALNLGYNALRAARRRTGYEALSGYEGPAVAPEAAAPAADERRQVRRALARLKQRDASLLVLRYGGASYREIAETLGVAPTSVGTLLRRAEAAFERAYGAITVDGEGRRAG